MFVHRKKRRAQSTLELALLVVLILAAFYIFQRTAVRSIAGRWKATGDMMGHGRLLDAFNTIECDFDIRFPEMNRWYNRHCFYDNCETDCFTLRAGRNPSRSPMCNTCIGSCLIPACNALSDTIFYNFKFYYFEIPAKSMRE